MELRKKSIKKRKKTRIKRVNSSNLQFELWNCDNLIKNKLKKLWSPIPDKFNVEGCNWNWKID
jgi:hypothetical protein